MKITENIKIDELIKDANILYEQSKYQESLLAYEEVSILYKKHGNWKNYVTTCIKISSCYSILGQANNALELLQQTKDFALEKLGEQTSETGLIYSEIGLYFINNGNFKSSYNYLQKALQIHIAVSGAESLNVGKTYTFLAKYYNSQQLHQKSLKFFEKALFIFLKILGEDNIFIASTYNNLAHLEGEIGRYDKQKDYAEKSLSIATKLFGEDHLNISYCYLTLGVTAALQGDSEQSLFYYQKAIQIRTEKLGANHPLTLELFQNLGAYYISIANYEEAISCFEKILHSDQQILPSALSTVYPLLSEAYIALGNTEKAFAVLEKYRLLCIDLYGENSFFISTYHRNIAHCYFSLDKPKEALTHIQKVLDICKATTTLTHPRVAESYLQAAYFYAQKNNFTQQLYYCHQALVGAGLDLNANDVYDIPIAANNNNIVNLFNALEGKAKAFYGLYQEQGEKKDLLAAFQSYDFLCNFIHQMRKSYKTESSKLNLSKKAGMAYAEAIDVACLLHDFSKAFHFLEQSKAALMLENMQDIEAKIKGNISAELLQKEKDIKIKLNYLDKSIALQEEKRTDKNKKILSNLQNQYFDWKQKYDLLIEQIEREYPQYYQIKYDTKIADIELIRQYLPADAVMINYYVSEKKYYILALDHQNYEVLTLPKPKDFESVITRFTTSIDSHNKEEFIALGHQIYKWLLSPIGDMVLDAFEEIAHKPLIIIPNDVLAYVPFEALLYEKTAGNVAYENLPFLLKQCVVSYHYSATLWLHSIQNKQNKEEIPYSFVGFAPIYTNPTKDKTIEKALEQSAIDMRSWANRSASFDKKSGWKPLIHSEAEVSGVQQLFEKRGHKTTTFLYQTANKNNFIKEANKAKFLLIAAHGLVNDEQPALSGLVFYPAKNETDKISITAKNSPRSTSSETREKVVVHDSILSMKEAYLLDLKADLVVLSSCESGIGKLAKGEGMMAINRGFLYSGASNVIFTLFKVYDKPSSELISLLFSYILQGMTYAEALQSVKLAFLNKKMADPKLWTAYVLIGS